MSKASDAYFNTIEKWQNALVEIQKFLHNENFEEANKYLEQFRSYPDCNYCQSYRKTLAGGFKGACDGCPMHSYGEFLTQTSIPYNGCYKIGNYRKMVRSAVWFDSDRSKPALKDFYDRLKDALEELVFLQARFC